MKLKNELNSKKVIALDIDGCIAPNTWKNKLVSLRDGLSDVIWRMHDDGYQLTLATGQALPGIRKIRNLMNLPSLPALAEHGGLYYMNGSCPEFLLPASAVNEFMDYHRPLAIGVLMGQFKGKMDPYDFIIVCEVAPKMQARAIKKLYEIDDVADTCDVGYNPSDRRITIKPRGVTKDNLFMKIGGNNLLIAAGDSSSDLVLLKRADYAIVTFDEGETWNKELTAVVEERGEMGGYIAQKNEPDGIGLKNGLLRAYELGVL